jgi:hypothetical protein
MDWSGWWVIGVDAGWGVAAGVLLAALLAGTRRAGLTAGLAAAGVGAAIGFLLWHWPEAVGGTVGGALGGLAAEQIVGGALRRGGTRGGTLVLVAGAAVVIAALAVAPIVGYVETAVLPLLALRMRRRAPERYAGLRTLARD